MNRNFADGLLDILNQKFIELIEADVNLPVVKESNRGSGNGPCNGSFNELLSG